MAKAKKLVCAVCSKPLDHNRDAIVYLGWGARRDGLPGAGWVVALHAPTPAQTSTQVGRDKSCAGEGRRRIESTGTKVVPSTYEAWLGK